jgi:hypothetical protein
LPRLPIAFLQLASRVLLHALMHWHVEVQPVVAAAVPVTALTACIHSQHDEHAQHNCVQQQLAFCVLLLLLRAGHMVVCGVGNRPGGPPWPSSWCWCGLRPRLMPSALPSPGHGAASCSAWCACPPSAPARGKAPQLLSRPASNAPLKCTRVAAAPQEAQHSSTHSSLCSAFSHKSAPGWPGRTGLK